MSMYASRPAPKQSAKAEAPARSQSQVDIDNLKQQYARLASTRSQVRQVLDSRPEDVSRETWALFLLPAAKEVLDAISELVDNDPLWKSIREAEVATSTLDAEHAEQLRQLVDLNLLGLMDLMEYRPPPPSLDLVVDLQAALATVLSSPDRALRAEWSREARFHLSIYNNHLRRLIAAAESLSPDDAESPSIRVRTTAALRAGLRAAGPGTLAAFATGLLFPPAGVAGFAGAAAYGGVEALQEFTKQGVQVAAATVVGKALRETASDAEPVDIYVAAVKEYISSIADLNSAAHEYKDSPTEEAQAAVQAIGIEATRWFYQVLRAQSAVADRRDRLMHGAQDEALAALRQIQDWTVLGIEDDFDEMVLESIPVVFASAVKVARHVDLLAS